MSNAATAKRTLKSAKSRGGCQRCRAKRIKCDEAKPSCNICLASDVACPGYTRQLRWSNKHEVYAKPPQHKRTSSASNNRTSNGDSRPIEPDDVSMASVPESRDEDQDVMLSDGAAFAAAWGGGEMGDLFEWPNFEICGFGDLGLLTPVMGQGQGVSPELDTSSWAAAVPTQANAMIPQASDSIDGLLAMNHHHQTDAVVNAPQPQSAATQPQEKPQSSDDDSGKSSPRNDSVSLLQTFYRLSMPSEVPGFSDQDLVHHYFNNICMIYSCVDCDLNPFRTLVADQWTDDKTTYLAMQSMSVGHLANFYPHMAPLGLTKRSQAWLSLQRDLRSVREGKGNADKVLLCLLLLGLSSSWHPGANMGQQYLFAARDMVQTKLRNSKGPQTDKDEFFLDALLHWEMLASFIDPVPHMPLSGLKSPTPRLPISEGPKFPHPWTGVSKELHFCLAEIGRVLRRQRYVSSASGLTAQRRETWREQDEEWMTKLESILLDHALPEPENIQDYEDPRTPKIDMARISGAYRYIALLEIYNACPELLQRRMSDGASPAEFAPFGGYETVQQQLTGIALHALEIIKPIAITSGACRLMAMVLLSSASQLRMPPATPAANTEDAARAEEIVEARYLVEARMLTLSRKYPQRPLLQIVDIIKEVWEKLDGNLSGAHWMDVTLEHGWQTTFG